MATLVLRTTKGSPLTNAELDQNFINLNQGLVDVAYTLPRATANILGGVKIGAGLTIATDGTVSAPYSYTLPISTNSVLGGVKIGANISVTNDGTISVATPYSLPVASFTTLGGVRVGQGLAIDGSGLLTNTFVLPTASNGTLGGVKIGARLTIDGNGVLSANIQSANGTPFDGASSGFVAQDVQNALIELNTKKANIDSPTFTGTPAVPNPPAGDNSTKIVNTNYLVNYVQAQGYNSQGAKIVEPMANGVPSNLVGSNGDIRYQY